MKGKDAEIEKIKSDYAFDAAVKEAIRKASGRNREGDYGINGYGHAEGF